MKRMLVWCESRAQMEQIIKQWFGGQKCSYIKSANDHGYWLKQPGEFPEDKVMRVFASDFSKQVTITVGSGSTKRLITTCRAKARAQQYD